MADGGAMPKLSHDIPVRKLDKTCVMEIHVKLTKEFKVRMFMAVRLFKLAAWVIGCGVRFKETNQHVTKERKGGYP